MQYLIFVLGNTAFAALDIPLSKSQCKFFGSIIILIIILLLHVLAFFFNFSNNILYVSYSLFFNIAKKVV